MKTAPLLALLAALACAALGCERAAPAAAPGQPCACGAASGARVQSHRTQIQR